MKKTGKKKIDFDRLFLRLVIGSIAAAIVLFAAVFISWFFEIDIQSADLWIGALIVFLSFFLIYATPFYWKVVVIAVSIFAISIYLYSVFGWSIELGLLFGLIFVIFLVSAYLSM